MFQVTLAYLYLNVSCPLYTEPFGFNETSNIPIDVQNVLGKI